MKLIKKLIGAALALASLGFVAPLATAQENPKEIRIGISAAGVGGKPKVGGTFVTTAHLRGVLEEEFRKDGIKVVWNLFPGAGPSTNEALANRRIDFGWHGDLPMIVGRSTGLRTKIILAAGRFGPVYFVVPQDSQARSLEDLKGQTISTFKGTALQLQLNRLLKKYGLKESDFRVINQDNFSASTSLSTGDIAGAIVTPWSLEARGVARRLLEIRDDKTIVAPSSFWVSEEFEQKYPQIVQRVVTALVKQAHWNSLEENRDEQFRLWAQSGIPFVDWKKDWEGYALRDRHSPLLDDYYVSFIKRAVQESKEFGLIRREVTVDDWIEPKYLDNALKSLKLEGFWPTFDAAGNIAKAGSR